MVLKRGAFAHDKVEVSALEVGDDEELPQLLVVGVCLWICNHILELDGETVRLNLLEHKQYVDFSRNHYKVFLRQKLVVLADVNHLNGHKLLALGVERLVDSAEGAAPEFVQYLVAFWEGQTVFTVALHLFY